MLSPFHCRRIVSKWTEDNRGIHALLAADHQKSRSGICSSWSRAIRRSDQNEEIFVRYMNDAPFRNICPDVKGMPESVVAALARQADDVTNKEDGRPP